MRQVWRQAHLKQPLGSRDGSRTRQRGGSGLKSTTGGSRGGSSSIDRPGGYYIKLQVRDPIARAVTAFAAETAAESAHVHACGAVASEEAVGFARDQARHMLRIGLELRAAARRMQVPLVPIATDRHALAMAELAKGGGEGSEKAALGRLGVCGAAVLDDGCFAKSFSHLEEFLAPSRLHLEEFLAPSRRWACTR